MAAQGACLWLDPSSVNAAIVNTFKSSCDRCLKTNGNNSKTNAKNFDGSHDRPMGPTGLYRISPVSLSKAVKNHAELEGMRDSHLR